jgi:hypothetical protein
MLFDSIPSARSVDHSWSSGKLPSTLRKNGSGHLHARREHRCRRELAVEELKAKNLTGHSQVLHWYRVIL